MTDQEIIDVISKAEYDEDGLCTNVMYRRKGNPSYSNTAQPTWDFNSYEYRIKPKKRIVDLTKEDLDKRIRNNQTLAIQYDNEILNWESYDKYGIVYADSSVRECSWKKLKAYKWADGTNCYKEIEE